MLLTIAIPTFNRLPKLKRQLENLAKQTRDLKNVEVLISDNASNDGSAVFLGKFCGQRPQFKWRQNQSNLGFDANILSLYSNAAGQYIWFLSDDDVIVNQGISRVCSILTKHKPAALYTNLRTETNPNPYVADDTPCDLAEYERTDLKAQFVTDCLFRPATELQRLILVRLMDVISCCIVRKDKSLVEKLPKYVGTGVIQDAITSLTLLHGNTAWISKEALVVFGEKEYNSRWYIESCLFGIDKLFSQKELGHPVHLTQRLGVHTAVFGLKCILYSGIDGRLFTDYRLNLTTLAQLLLHYRSRFLSIAFKLCKDLLVSKADKWKIRVRQIVQS